MLSGEASKGTPQSPTSPEDQAADDGFWPDMTEGGAHGGYSGGEGPESGESPQRQESSENDQDIGLDDEAPLELEDPPIITEALFESLAGEAFQTVFKNPELDFIQWGPESSDQPPDDDVQLDPQLFIKNLDTNEYRPLADESLTCSFLQDENTHLEEVAVTKDGGKTTSKPWADWWAEKRNKDESLWRAAESGSIDRLREALAPPEDASAPRASVNSKFLYGRTAMHITASVGKPEGIEFLLDAGAELEARTDAGLTALHVAVQRGNLGVVTLLVDRGAEISPQTDDRNLPLHFAAMNGHVDVLALLLERGKSEQLGIRNSVGRRAAEVCLDIATSDAFRDYEAKVKDAIEKANGEGGTAADGYAGRTAYAGGEVLLHNARADMVFKLLNKTNKIQNSDMLASGDEPDSASKSLKDAGTGGRSSVHAPFVKVRPEVTIEKVGPESFTLLDRLGKGSFGEVFQVKHKHTDEVYAMKILRKSKVMSGNLLRYTLTERNVLSYINHPYMVSLHYAFQTSNYLVLLLQYCPGGNMQQLIEREKRLPDCLAQLYVAEILLALCHLHERQIVFRDLKPDNVVLDEIGHAMLTDFGLSKEGVSAVHCTKSFCGSIAFIAPEILQRKGHNHTVDIYGMGVILFDMLTGMPPFYNPDREKLYHNIKHARLAMPRGVTKAASSLIYTLMERDPKARLGAANTKDVQKHEYFATMDFDALMRREVPPPIQVKGANSGRTASNRAVGRYENPFKDGGAGSTSKTSQNVSGWSFTGGFGGPPEAEEFATPSKRSGSMR